MNTQIQIRKTCEHCGGNGKVEETLPNHIGWTACTECGGTGWEYSWKDASEVFFDSLIMRTTNEVGIPNNIRFKEGMSCWYVERYGMSGWQEVARVLK